MLTYILDSLARLPEWQNLLDIALVALIFYGLLRLFRGTQAVQLVRGILVIALFIIIILQANLTAISLLLQNSTQVLLFALPVIFQPELRRALERVGRSAPLLMRRVDNADTQRLVNAIVLATEQLSQRKHGALIVFESSTGLREYIGQGTPLDAVLTVELLLTVFMPSSALHDGAVIVSGERLAAAGCILPLTQRQMADSQLGTRHRAAIGLSEQVDALIVVVSEETGTISVARTGRMVRVEPDRLRPILTEFYS